MKFNYLVFAGRFQPVHDGHVHVITEALKLSEKLIIVIGSADKARDIRNPFSVSERIELIKLSIPEAISKRIEFIPQVDYTYNDDRWIASIQTAVYTISQKEWKAGSINVGIIGYEKDHTSYYLKKFPQWEFVEITPYKELSSTQLRELLFEERYFDDYVKSFYALSWLNDWKKTEEFQLLQKEYYFIQDYKKGWSDSPYPPTFVTVDAIVRQSGHILIVERGAMPGEGLWALPGGFVNQNETLEEAVLRELVEETGIKVPRPVLKGSLVTRMTFDDPHRSTRGRTITECFDFKLNDTHDLPKVKGGDDAKKAFWVSFNDTVKNRQLFFEDHFSIIQCMIGL